MAYLSSFQPKEGTFINVKPNQTLSGRVASAMESEEELDPTDSVLTVFPVQPRRDYLHIVVRKPDTGEWHSLAMAEHRWYVPMPKLPSFSLIVL